MSFDDREVCDVVECGDRLWCVTHERYAQEDHCVSGDAQAWTRYEAAVRAVQAAHPHCTPEGCLTVLAIETLA